MADNALRATENQKIKNACKDANVALTLGIISIYASSIPLLGAVTALVAERIAYKTPDVEGISNIRTKKNVVHYLTPFTFVLSVLFAIFYYHEFHDKF